ncbi:hypothetical protein CEXT_590171 [Caerostris extrusa]|uniref:Uncharacterized protein n=1 Tax=Caerostris extrusa TaxID=172846 RepID=A0AAV4WPC2_CAEEX|nr:hypothetical protein CEXT_590171 [Caerostris extrusa]
MSYRRKLKTGKRLLILKSNQLLAQTRRQLCPVRRIKLPSNVPPHLNRHTNTLDKAPSEEGFLYHPPTKGSIPPPEEVGASVESCPLQEGRAEVHPIDMH